MMRDILAGVIIAILLSFSITPERFGRHVGASAKSFADSFSQTYGAR